MSDLRRQIGRLPKSDVHNHLHLGGSIKALREKYSHTNIAIPKYFNGLDGMIDFIYNNLNKIMLTSNDVIFFMENAIKSGIDDNVENLEASVDINLTKFFDNSIEKLIDVVYELKRKYKSQIDFRPDIGINKDCTMDKVYSDGLVCVNSGVFNGIDIYGKESNRKLDGFVKIYNSARNRNIKTKVHIGEFSDCQTIEEAIFLLNPDEIQHGIMAANSENTMDMILNNNIQLNICTQSNISLGSVKNISEHPIRKLYDHGIKITINTDDLLLFNATITDQFIDLIENSMFSLDEIESIRKNGFN
jgi:adenosine deaminase